MRTKICILVLVAVCAVTVWSITRPAEVPFEKILIDSGASETAAFADINGDGKLDIVSGEYWYEAPKWTPHKFRDDRLRSRLHRRSSPTCRWTSTATARWTSSPPTASRTSWCGWRTRARPAACGRNTSSTRATSSNSRSWWTSTNSGKADCILPQYGGANAPTAWYEHKDGGFVKHVVSPQNLRPRHRRGRRQRRRPHRHHHARGLVRGPAGPAHRRVEVAPRLPPRRHGLHPRAGHQRRRPSRHRHYYGPRLRDFLDGADRGRQVDQAHDRRYGVTGCTTWCWWTSTATASRIC